MNDDANRFLAHNIKGLMMDRIVAWDLRIAAARAESEFAELSAGDLKVMGLLRGRPDLAPCLALDLVGTMVNCGVQVPIRGLPENDARSAPKKPPPKKQVLFCGYCEQACRRVLRCSKSIYRY